MRTLSIFLFILLTYSISAAQDLVLLDGSRSKVIAPGKFLTLEIEPPYDDECECNRRTVFGQLHHTDEENVVLEVYEDHAYLAVEGISTTSNEYYKEGYAVQKAIPKSTILSIKKWRNAKAEKTRETFIGIGALFIITGVGTATTSALTLETGPRGEVLKAGVGQMLTGILLASIFSAKKRFVTSSKSNFHKGNMYSIR